MRKIILLVLVFFSANFLTSCSTDESQQIIQSTTIFKSNQELENDCDPCILLKAEINASYNEQISWYIENHPNPDVQHLILLHMERMNFLASACEEPSNISNCDACTLLKAEINATMNEQLKWYMENHTNPSAQDIIQQHQEKMSFLASACEEPSSCDPCTLLKAEINATMNEQLKWYMENHTNPSAQDIIQQHLEKMSFLVSACEDPVDDSNCDSCTLLRAEINASYNEQLSWYIDNHPNPDVQYMILLHMERMDYLAAACD